MELKLDKLAQMPSQQIARINTRMREDCKEQELRNIEADQQLRTTRAAQRQFENLCQTFST